MRFLCPKNTDGVSIDHQQFDADIEGIVEAPLRFKERLEALGFRPAPDKIVEEPLEETEEPSPDKIRPAALPKRTGFYKEK